MFLSSFNLSSIIQLMNFNLFMIVKALQIFRFRTKNPEMVH